MSRRNERRERKRSKKRPRKTRRKSRRRELRGGCGDLGERRSTMGRMRRGLRGQERMRGLRGVEEET